MSPRPGHHSCAEVARSAAAQLRSAADKARADGKSAQTILLFAQAEAADHIATLLEDRGDTTAKHRMSMCPRCAKEFPGT